MTEYYASPTGTGDGLSAGNPFLIADAWPIINPGDTLWLADGTYQGANSMLRPTSGVVGTSNSPITVKATNDGEVEIDGQGGVEAPLHLIGNDWMVFEGMNIHSGSAGSVKLYQADNCILRRIVAWDACAPVSTNASVLSCSTTSNTLFEDCAGFGTGRKIFSTSQEGNSTTFRRCWGRYEENTATSPKVGVSTGYNNDNCIAENCIMTWDATGTTTNAFSLFRTGGNDDDTEIYAKIYGCIGYITSDDTVQFGQAILVNKGDNIEYKDVAIYIEPGSHTGIKQWSLGSLVGSTATNLSASNMTGIGGSTGTFDPDWSTSNIEQGATVGSVSSIWTDDGNGAHICTRYVDGVNDGLTPLWPWPMDARIKAALIAGGSKSVTSGQSNDSGLVTDMVEQLFGTIPAACRSDEEEPESDIIRGKIAPTNKSLRITADRRLGVTQRRRV